MTDSRNIIIAAATGSAVWLLAILLTGCSQQPAPRLPVPDEAPAAETDFDKAADRPPTLKTLYVMGKLYSSQGKVVEAEGALRRVIAGNPKFIPAYCDLAEVQVRQKRTDEAILTLENGLKVSPRDPILLNDLGMCHLLKDDYFEALSSFRDAASARPNDIRYRSNVAVALGMLGRYDEALSAYSQVLSPADAHYNLGVICESRRDHDRAAVEFRKSIELQGKQQATSEAARKSHALGALAAAQQRQDVKEPSPSVSVEPKSPGKKPSAPRSKPAPPADVPADVEEQADPEDNS